MPNTAIFCTFGTHNCWQLHNNVNLPNTSRKSSAAGAERARHVSVYIHSCVYTTFAHKITRSRIGMEFSFWKIRNAVHVSILARAASVPKCRYKYILTALPLSLSLRAYYVFRRTHLQVFCECLSTPLPRLINSFS